MNLQTEKGVSGSGPTAWPHTSLAQRARTFVERDIRAESPTQRTDWKLERAFSPCPDCRQHLGRCPISANLLAPVRRSCARNERHHRLLTRKRGHPGRGGSNLRSFPIFRLGMPVSSNLRFATLCMRFSQCGRIKFRYVWRHRRFSKQSFADKCVPNREIGNERAWVTPVPGGRLENGYKRQSDAPGWRTAPLALDRHGGSPPCSRLSPNGVPRIETLRRSEANRRGISDPHI